VSGRIDDPAVYQRNAATGEGFVAMNEVPGIMKRIDTSWTWQGGIQLMYDTDIFPFERRVDPDETFATASVGIAVTAVSCVVFLPSLADFIALSRARLLRAR
jgi:alpha-galactosidase